MEAGGRLCIELPGASPNITTYAGAARALGSNLQPAAVRLAVARALVDSAPVLQPSPLPLVALHVVYVLNHADAAGADPGVRAQYWQLLARICRGPDGARVRASDGHGLGAAAIAGLKGGDADEIDAVLFVLESEADWIGGSLEGRAELVAALVPAGGDDRGKGVVRGWAESQGRCTNGKRTAGAVVRFILPCLVAESGAGWGVGLRSDVAASAVKGLFAVPAAALEGGGYYKELYQWLRGMKENTALSHVVSWMMDGFLLRVREETESIDANTHREVKKRKRATSISKSDDGWGVLPQSILVPLVFFKDVLLTLRSMLDGATEASSGGIREPAVAALARLFEVASKAGVYRPSYDLRPTVKSRKKANGEREKADTASNSQVTTSNVDSTSAPIRVGLPDPSEGINVGREVARVVRTVTGLIEANSTSEALSSAISAALLSALSLSLDAVVGEVPTVLKGLSKYVANVQEGDVKSIAIVIAKLVSAYAATRQLPCLGVVIGQAPAGLAPALSADCVLDALSSVTVVAPRGHAALFVQALFTDTNAIAEFDIAPVLTMATVVLEASPAVEHVELAKAFAENVMPAIVSKHGKKTTTGVGRLLLLQMRTSILYVMANAGTPLSSPIFAKCLFDDGSPGLVDGGESSPDSDSSDYDSFMEQRRRRESPRARFVQALSQGSGWNGPARETLKSKKKRPCDKEGASSKKLRCVIGVDVLATYLRFLASLAHVCASDSVLCMPQSLPLDTGAAQGQASSTTPPSSPTGTTPAMLAAPAVELVLREVWKVFEALDILQSTASGDVCHFAASKYAPLVLAGGSVVGLLRPSRRERAVHSDCDGVSAGFKTFVALALTGGCCLDSLWDELWECRAVSGVFVGVMSETVSFMPRSALHVALTRCANMPRRYLSTSEEQTLNACCLRVIESVPSDLASMWALAVLGRSQSLLVDLGNLETLTQALVATVGNRCGDSFVAALLRQGLWIHERPAVKGRAKLLSILIKRCSSLEELTWYLRCATRAVDEQLDDSTVRATDLPGTIHVVVSQMEDLVVRSAGADSGHDSGDAIASVFGAAQALAELLLCIRNVGDHRAGTERESSIKGAETVSNESAVTLGPVSTSGIDLEHVKLALRRIMTVLLPLCCIPSQPKPFMVCSLTMFLRGGKRSPCSIAFGESQGLTIKLRLAALCLSWLHEDESTRSTRLAAVGEDSDASNVLAALLNGDGARGAVASAVCDALRLELESGRPGHAHATRVVLSCGVGDQSLTLACLESMVRVMRFWGWFSDVVKSNDLRNEPEIGGRDIRLEHSSMVHEAVSGAESWARTQAGRSVRSSTEHLLQLLARILSSRFVASESIDSALRTVSIVVKQASGSHGPSGQVPSGILWAAERMIRSALLHPSRVREATAVALSRAFESVANIGNGATPHAISLTAAAVKALTCVDSAAVRRSLLPGVGSLLGTGDSSDAVVRGTMTILREDVEKDILRALRSEIIESDSVYKGRA